MTLSGGCAVTGASVLAARRTTPGQTTLGLIGRLAAAAVADAGLEPAEVDDVLSPGLTATPLAAAISDVCDMSGTSVGDIDLFALYDCYSIMLALTFEDAGLCAKGEVGPWLLEQDFSHTGNVPTNTHGGQADLAGGMSHLVEAVRQLRGEGGPRQVPDAELALVTGNGATLGEEVALVMGAER
ncbi:hypothetical protein FB384_003518 [Prauserella sediminis]|uniref:Thiolase C-terminal domain-containing protein n=1 Tax=Prauserella sediminis TaxID=577680 RepID=A0A839XT62_9PSEU|nr:hypothetical protein [Prauserella sediminis]MBB3664614.1 hypothetical protein [Prauserella sediminis]